MSVTAGLNSGNNEYAALSSSIRMDYTVDRGLTTFLVGNLQYREGSDRKIANQGFLHYRFIHPITELISPELFLQRQFNAFTNLLDRSLGGSGIRFTIINSEDTPDSLTKADLMIGIGVMYEKETLRRPDRYTTEIARSTNYINYKLLTPDGFGLSSVLYYQPSLRVSTDWRLLAKIGLMLPITKGVSFLVDLDYSYDNEPPIDIKNYDLALRNGITIRL